MPSCCCPARGLDQLNPAALRQLNQIPKILLLSWREFESLGELELNEGDVRVEMPTIAQGIGPAWIMSCYRFETVRIQNRK